jgi:hypothetical protein
MNLLQYSSVTNSNDVTVSQEIVSDYVEAIDVNEKCSLNRAINPATIRNG